MDEEEKLDADLRLEKIDQHMYLDDNSSAGPLPDPEEHPDRIVYAPVKPVTIKHEDEGIVDIQTPGRVSSGHLKIEESLSPLSPNNRKSPLRK